MYVVGWLCFSTLEKWPSVGDVLCIPAMHTPFSSPQDQGPAGPRVVSGLHLQTWSAGCGTVVFLLLVSGPWWVELGLGPLVGKAMSRGMSRGSCGLRKSLGSLSTDGWGCVPTQFVVWGFYLVPLSGTYFSAVSFCLNFYLYFYVCGRLVTFLNLGEVALCRGCPGVPAVYSPLITQGPGTIWSQGRF